MTVQDVVSAVSLDVRSVLANSGADATTITGWVDRVHKEVLHTTLYVNDNLATTSVTTTAGTTNYTLSPPNPIRRIVSVYDTTFNKPVLSADLINNPSPNAAISQEREGASFQQVILPAKLQLFNYAGTAEYYRYLAPTTFVVQPAPISSAYTGTLSIVYEEQVVTVSALGTTLVVPNDALDVMVAGVNWMAFSFLGRTQDAMMWFQVYQELKKGERVGIIK